MGTKLQEVKPLKKLRIEIEYNDFWNVFVAKLYADSKSPYVEFGKTKKESIRNVFEYYKYMKNKNTIRQN